MSTYARNFMIHICSYSGLTVHIWTPSPTQESECYWRQGNACSRICGIFVELAVARADMESAQEVPIVASG